MRIEIEPGVRLYVDVAGAGLVPDDEAMRERPALLLLHGGPGADHSTFKPDFDSLTDAAQIVYYDHRGNGRSDPRPKEEWNLEMWSADVGRLIDALGLVKPIILGTSFGGVVAQQYAATNSDRLGGVILQSTMAVVDIEATCDIFRQLGGNEAADAARSVMGPDPDPSPEARDRFFALCGPHYTQSEGNVFGPSRILWNHEMAQYFIQGEGRTMDLRSMLPNVTAPTLILNGALDPITPASGARTIRDLLGSSHVDYVEFENCGHGTQRDKPTETMATIRDFINKHGSPSSS